MKPLLRYDAERHLEKLSDVRDQIETRTFGVNRNDVAAIDEWLEEISARWGANERAMFGVRLCIAELAANTLEHGTAVSSEDHIIVTVRSDQLGIQIEFLDSRAPFDPTAKPRALREELLESAHPRGRGLCLVHLYADRLTYSHDGTYNRVSLTIKQA
jgi:anti-sigma regulatory factor (Ser/Thr protein kinase)